jgi:hypothetical protein
MLALRPYFSEWDRKHGLASLRARQHRLIRAHFAATEGVIKNKANSIAGTTALIEYLNDDMKTFESFESGRCDRSRRRSDQVRRPRQSSGQW